ncbi:asialoglycoprotein receptor 2-like [Leucoraja erinacea]|uniref:asialoglycoprotein receptor 2-like n=1 Tax=Leucoraja erinaceus TaxID=7782 RepID=UPI002454187E|nr:asialoglycoprotein receptor 2-like [Leucoraja erinacea]
MTIAELYKLLTDIPRLSVNSCPEQWTRFNQRCYHFSSTKSTWEEAKRYCALADAQLVVINDAEEQRFLEKLCHVIRWIGLSDSASEGDWRWVDGTDYRFNLKFWAAGELHGQRGFEEDCAALSDDGLWRDWPCSAKHYVICEKNSNVTFPLALQRGQSGHCVLL